MNLLQFSGHEIGSNRRLHAAFTTRRKPARRFSPALDSLEGRQLLSTVGYVAEFRMNPASPKKMQPTGAVAMVRSPSDLLPDVQKVRDAAAPDVQKVREALPAGIGILKCPE